MFLVTDVGSLPVPADVAAHVEQVTDRERLQRWERHQCRLALDAWAMSQTHVITAEGLGGTSSGPI